MPLLTGYPRRPNQRKSQTKPAGFAASLPTLENLFPRTLGNAAATAERKESALAAGDPRGAGAESVRGAVAGGFMALPADLVSIGGKARAAALGPALSTLKSVFGGAESLQPPAAPAVPEPPIEQAVARPPLEGVVQPRQEPQDPVRAALTKIARGGDQVGVPTVPAPQQIRPSPLEQINIPQLPAQPTYGDLLTFRLNALQQRGQSLGAIGQEKQARQATEENQQAEGLQLRGLALARLTRQGDTSNQIQALSALGRQKEPKFSDVMKEKDAEQDYIDRYWPHGQALGEAAFAISKQTDIPLETLSKILTEEMGDTPLREENIPAVVKRLREQALATR